jgi:hypothetical protein
MTAYRFVTLTCDECGEVSDGGMDRSVKQARATARADGWGYEHRRDICPSHRGYTRICGDGFSVWVRDDTLARIGIPANQPANPAT